MPPLNNPKDLVCKARVNGHIARDLARRIESSEPYDNDEPKFVIGMRNTYRPEVKGQCREPEYSRHETDSILVCGKYGAGIRTLLDLFNDAFRIEYLDRTPEGADNRFLTKDGTLCSTCLLYTSPSPRDS